MRNGDFYNRIQTNNQLKKIYGGVPDEQKYNKSAIYIFSTYDIIYIRELCVMNINFVYGDGHK